MEYPFVSIIIPVKNAENTIRKCIQSVKELDYDNYELIMVNDGSDDRTGEIINDMLKDGRIKSRILNSQSKGPSFARNIAVKEAKGALIAFTDSDCILDKSWLKELYGGIESGADSAGGLQLSPEDETDYGRNVNEFMGRIGFITDYMKASSQMAGLEETDHNPTCNVMYKREVFDKTGGFLEDLWPGEDVELDYRVKKAGYKMVINPKAVVYHYRPKNLEKYIKMMTSYGRVQAFLFKKYGFFRKIFIVPFLFLCLLVLLVFLGYKSLFWLVIALILMDTFVWIFFYARTKNFRKTIDFGMLFYATLFFWNWGFLKGLFTQPFLKK
jgi:glycosyltransferase involved in cell wall biosynthesis